MTRILRGGCLAALLLLAGILTPTFAANIGVIDFQVIEANYKGAEASRNVMQQYYNQLSVSINALEMGLGLSEEDLGLYKKLTMLTAREEDKIKGLEEKSLANQKTFLGLRGKVRAALSAAEQQEFDYLYKQIISAASQVTMGRNVEQELKEMELSYQNLEKKGVTALQGDEVKTYETLQQIIKKNTIELANLDNIRWTKLKIEQQRHEKIFSAELEKAVAKVAKEQKLSVVINKNVQTSRETTEKLVLWTDGNSDISDKVVKALNDSFKLDLFKLQ